MPERKSSIVRETKETQIKLMIRLDGSGRTDIHTGIGFFDHMLNSFARHGFIDLDIDCKGDLEVDCHHTIEDVGIVLGQGIKEALGGKEGIKRFGSFILPMDESLMLCSLDLSGRPYLIFDVNFTEEKVGQMDTAMVKEFFHAIAYGAGMNLHIKELEGGNHHHMIEGIFKAFGRALDEAVGMDSRITGVLSTKGSLS